MAPNPHVVQRLNGIRAALNAVYEQGKSMSSASKGHEREGFINAFLANVLPPIYRFGTGDATDESGARSGQLDVVVEYPFGPSLPSTGSSNPTRLYLAESVAAVIEVKSNLASQWDEVEHTAAQLAPLRRQLGPGFAVNFAPLPRIPLFVVAYTGWKSIETAFDKLVKSGNIAGALVIDSGIYVSSPDLRGIAATEALALWAFICDLHLVTNSLQASGTNPLRYIIDLTTPQPET